VACETNALPSPTAAEKREARRQRALAAVQPRLLDLPATAVYLGLSEWSVRELEWSGVLRPVRVPSPTAAGHHASASPAHRRWDKDVRRLLFDRYDLDRLVESWKEPAR
jgi:hypothetical protein